MTCIHCANFHKDIYPKIKEKYIDTNIIKFVFRDFPLDKQALFASVLAKCAPKKKYFDFVKLILTTQEKWISNDESFMDKLKNPKYREHFDKTTFVENLDFQDVIEKYDFMLRSPSINIPMPSVIRLKKYARFKTKNIIISR